MKESKDLRNSSERQSMEFTSDSAKQFLLSKLGEQAAHDGVVVDEVEQRMFLFSEAGGNPDFEASEEFDRDHDTKAYESKIAKLLGRAYTHDKQTDDGKALWKAALKALSRDDFYGLVMVDQAKIPRVDEGLRAFFLSMLPLALAEIGLLGLGCALVFQPFRLGLHLPDWLRLLLMPLFFWLFWYVGRIFGRSEMAKSAKQTESQEG